jgi:butyryl-CoA dehydrogenase
MDFNLSASQLSLQARAREVGMRWRGQYAKWDAEDEAPYREVVASLRDAGLLGLTIPKEYGGKGGDALDYAIVVEELIRTSRSWILGEGPFATTGPGPSMILLAQEISAADRERRDRLRDRVDRAQSRLGPHGA